jgi:hypothetical protein
MSAPVLGRPDFSGRPARPYEVLDQQAALAARLKQPRRELLKHIRDFMTGTLRLNMAGEHSTRWTGAPADVEGNFGITFYPAVVSPPPVASQQNAADLTRALAMGTADATAYQVTSVMVNAITEMLPETQQHIDHLDVAELPERNGWAWLDTPWPLPDPDHDDLGPVLIRVVSWSFLSIPATDDLVGLTGGTGQLPCVRITLWTLLDDDLAQNLDRYEPGRAEEIREHIGELTLMHTVVVPFAATYTKENSLKGLAAASPVAFTHLLWMFLGMEITAIERAPIARPVRRQALRSLKHGEVHVVTLRRVRHHDDPDDAVRVIDWSCQWPVQGHARHLDSYSGPQHRAVTTGPGKHCAVCGSRTTWIRPYLKGPDGLPLKVSRQLMRLSR